ncbi:Cytidylyltransferase [Musa troglodytarum]|uniref:Cytidylyltransferase n=1 Tax=Musa troglodytarum TaxID=320322 RepID=A0A9E7FL44_9LILI|nr:Cytidylyltransferase [Musa troglodytarum]
MPTNAPSSSGDKTWIVPAAVLGVAAAVAAGAHAAARYRVLPWLGNYRSWVVGIIPARFASSRFPGKPLVRILGKPMIQVHRLKSKSMCANMLIILCCRRTWERVKLASALDRIVVATDDEKIAECCRGFGADVIMTSEECKNGTECCYEALQKLGENYDIVVNIQGDEPLIEPEIIDGVVKSLQGSPDAVFSTAVTSLEPEDGLDPNRVKCVIDSHGYAIYFSRGFIPFNKLDLGRLTHSTPIYFTWVFRIYLSLPPTPLQLEEDLEQLKVLENGYRMKVIKVNHDAHGVDSPEDVDKIEALMRERNIS